MSFEMKTTLELVQIAAAGGGFHLDAKTRTTLELVQIAAAASQKGARLAFAGLNMRTTAELVQIAAAGKGCVVLEA
jgi:DNA replication protein